MHNRLRSKVKALSRTQRIVWGTAVLIVLGMCLCPPHVTKDSFYFLDAEVQGQNVTYWWPSYRWLWDGSFPGEVIYWRLLLFRCFVIAALGKTIITAIEETPFGFSFTPWLVWIFIWAILCLLLFSPEVIH